MSNNSEAPEDYDLDGMETKRAKEAGKGDRSMWLPATMDVVFGILVTILSGFFMYWSFSAQGMVLFAYHPALTSLGFILFMTEAINIYNNALLMGRGGKSYSTRVLAHWILHTIAIISITGGFIAIVYNKIRLGKHHFQTPHAIMGLVTFVLIFIVSAGGIAAKYSCQLRRRIRPIVVKLSHSVFGLAIYFLGGATLILGLFTKWFEKHRTSSDAYFAMAAIVVIWIYTSLRPLGQIFRRLKQMLTSI